MAFKAIGNFNQNNQLLNTTGNDTLGTVCMAGKSISDDYFSIIVSNPNKPSNGYSLNIQNLLQEYNYQITRIDRNNEFVIIDNGTVSPASHIITNTVSFPYVYFITFKKTSLGTNNSSVIKSNIFVYPNPTNDIITISTDKKYRDINISVFTISGKKILNITNQTEIDINSLSAGIYFIKIIMDDKIETKKIIKIE